jgi:elongation factor G
LRGDNSAVRLAGIEVPSPVFMCSVEAENTDQEKTLTEALDILQKEDPSLQVSVDGDTGQTLLKGLGELHLDIVRQRLLSQFKIEVNFGRMSVSYRETITKPSRASHSYRGLVRGNMSTASASIDIAPCRDIETVRVLVDAPEGTDPVLIASAERAAKDGCNRGALLGFPNQQVDLKISELVLGSDTTAEAVYAAVSRAVSASLKGGEPALLEPIARLELMCPPSNAGDVLSDLNSRRRAEVNNVELCSDPAVLDCTVPVSELIGYANSVRSLTKGTARYTTQLIGYRIVPEHIRKTLLSAY